MSNAFRPTGNTVRIDATTASASAQVTNNTQASSYRVHNGGATEVYIAFDPTAAPTAAIPAVGTPANGWPLHANATQVITANANGFFAVITTVAGPIPVFITPGEAVL